MEIFGELREGLLAYDGCTFGQPNKLEHATHLQCTLSSQLHRVVINVVISERENKLHEVVQILDEQFSGSIGRPNLGIQTDRSMAKDITWLCTDTN